MRTPIRIIKREEREALNNSEAAVKDQISPERIVKGWINSFRERKRAELSRVDSFFRPANLVSPPYEAKT